MVGEAEGDGVLHLIGKAAKLARLLGRPAYWPGLRRGVFGAVEHQGVLAATRPASVIDIGANRGQFSLAVRAAAPHAVIHAFEPMAAAAAAYHALFRADPRVSLHPFAAGLAAGPLTLHLSGRADSSSLLPITDRQNAAFPGTGHVGDETVEVRRVDQVLAGETLPAPLLVKLDVQGFELQALEGCQALLGQVDFIYVEVSFIELYAGQPLAPAVIDWLSSRGFVLDRIETVSRGASGEAVQSDVLFRRRAAQ
jgi:FkbM family methyltransferase